MHRFLLILALLVYEQTAMASLPGKSNLMKAQDAAPPQAKFKSVHTAKQSKDVGKCVPLPEIVRQTLALHFDHEPNVSLEDFAKRFSLPERYRQQKGLFVTLSKNGKTRACWGSIDPQFPDLVRSTIYTTRAALTKEYRYPPIKSYEWKLLKPQVTVVHSLQPIHNVSDQNAFRDGLMVRSGGKGAVILPGEAADAHYQLVQCKLKAGIPIDRPCQLYRITADVFH